MNRVYGGDRYNDDIEPYQFNQSQRSPGRQVNQSQYSPEPVPQGHMMRQDSQEPLDDMVMAPRSKYSDIGYSSR